MNNLQIAIDAEVVNAMVVMKFSECPKWVKNLVFQMVSAGILIPTDSIDSVVILPHSLQNEFFAMIVDNLNVTNNHVKFEFETFDVYFGIE